MTPRLALACVLTAALVPTGLSAQHAKESKEETKSTHAAAREDAAEHAAAAKHEAEPSPKSTAKESAREGTKSQSERTKASAREEEEAPAKGEHGEKKPGASARESARGGKDVAEAHDKEEKDGCGQVSRHHPRRASQEAPSVRVVGRANIGAAL